MRVPAGPAPRRCAGSGGDCDSRCDATPRARRRAARSAMRASSGARRSRPGAFLDGALGVALARAGTRRIAMLGPPLARSGVVARATPRAEPAARMTVGGEGGGRPGLAAMATRHFSDGYSFSRGTRAGSTLPPLHLRGRGCPRLAGRAGRAPTQPAASTAVAELGDELRLQSASRQAVKDARSGVAPHMYFHPSPLREPKRAASSGSEPPATNASRTAPAGVAPPPLRVGARSSRALARVRRF